MAVSKRLRYEILRRDSHACRYCGATAPGAPLTVDHVVPVALGGTDDPSNLVAACRDCNAGKSASAPDAPIVSDVEKSAIRWAAAMGIVARQRESDRAFMERVEEFLFDTWESNRPHQFRSCDLPVGWMDSIRQFIGAGLEPSDIEELIISTLGNRNVSRKWKYLCGCCWRRIRESQDAAAEIVSQCEEGDDGA